MTSVSGMAKASKNIMQSDLSLDTLKHVISSIRKLSSFLQFGHISSWSFMCGYKAWFESGFFYNYQV